MAEQKTNQQPEQDLSQQSKVRREKLAALQAEGRDPFQITRFDWDHTSAQIKENFDALEGQSVKVAGRLMSKRGMGKVSFCDLQDRDGRIQLYARQDEMDEEIYKQFKKYDIGDIVGVDGEVFRTQRGEMSVRAKTITLLSKSLLPLPEKFHGLQDKELRFRQRYVDLMVNPEVKRNFAIRSRFIKFMRNYLDDMGYIEVETPVLNTIAGGAAARPFITHHNTLDIDMYMRIATELPLKRLIVGGMDRVYEIGRIFRNEGMDPKHNPEFTTVELYQAYTDFHGMMDIAEGILSGAAQAILGTYQVQWQGEDIDLTPGWRRLTMVDAVKEYAGVDFGAITDDAEAVSAAKAIGVELADAAEKTWGNALYACFDQKVEEQLVQPTFITMYPVEVSPLTKRSPADPRLTERFELFICRSELANAYSELNDPIDQRERFEKQVEQRERGDEETEMLDEDFLTALEYGMPPTGGMGMGIDRCVMLLTGADTIREVILFPTMKPEGAKKEEKAADAPKASAPKAEAAPAAIDFSKVEIEPLFADFVDFETFSRSDFRAVKVKECTAVPKSKKLLKFVLDDGSGTDRVILSGIHDTYEPEELVGKTLIAITNLPPRKMMGIDSCGMIISAIHHEEGAEKLHCLMVDDRIPAGAKLY
ncbi:lysine--tRNA ligase [Dysosmobacter sp.]|uniref:lysine--tRNA ligase n=1 Tax=Dysosmobacter sp. TaxID=2591382 RepID=UPI002A9B85FF|nr:lysine--tRNA ligase [Dysosmobacter sp.]MCI6053768.1 lysine--tRNA ligase [Dysosmobacter sp.]MDY5509191.1 lysine--tRNA ligase [Dysosmobacter sp.]